MSAFAAARSSTQVRGHVQPGALEHRAVHVHDRHRAVERDGDEGALGAASIGSALGERRDEIEIAGAVVAVERLERPRFGEVGDDFSRRRGVIAGAAPAAMAVRTLASDSK